MNNLLLSMSVSRKPSRTAQVETTCFAIAWGHIIRLMQIEAEVANDLPPPETL